MNLKNIALRPVRILVIGTQLIIAFFIISAHILVGTEDEAKLINEMSVY